MITLEKGTLLYRGVNNSNRATDIPEPIWLAHTIEDAKLYGSMIYVYRVESDLKLINPMTSAFQIDYIRRLNETFKGTNFDGVDERKIQAALPFGLPDLETQVSYLRSKNVKIEDVKVWSAELENAVKFINNKHRYSTFERDELMIKVLQLLYGASYDGFCTHLKWPTKLHDGLFMREICLFKPSTKLTLIEKRGGCINCKPRKPRVSKKKGGTISKSIYEHVPTNDTWNRMADGIWDGRDHKALDEYILKDVDKDALQKMSLEPI